MKDRINVAELLRNCPKGMELDCVLSDSVELDGVDMSSNYPIKIIIGGKQIEYLSAEGCLSSVYYTNPKKAKCIIFPKGKTSWEGFQRPFEDGDIIYIRDEYSDATFTYVAILKQIKGEQIYSYCFYDYQSDKLSTDDYLYDGYNIRFATEEEKAKLFQAIKDNGYRWNSETKTLEKLIEPRFRVGDKIVDILRKHVGASGTQGVISEITDDKYIFTDSSYISIKDQDNWELVSDKFDITTLKPFESKVLVRNDEHQYWIPAFWGCKRSDGYTTTFGWCKYCIPFNGNEHLLETNDDCDDYFKTWKE